MKYREQILQEHFAHWLQAKGILFTASMMGVYLPVKYAVLRKKMGCVAGFPDIMIFHKNKKYAGLFIELKSDTGITSKEQQEIVNKLNKNGYLALIMPKFDDFGKAFNWLRDVVEEYLDEISLK